MESAIRSQTPKQMLLKPSVCNIEERKPVLSLASVPLLSTLRIKRSGTCTCDPEVHYHMDFIRFNSFGIQEFREDFESKVEVCFDNHNLFDKRLPKALGFSSFMQLKSFAEVNELLFRSTYWYRLLWDGSRPRRAIRWIGSLVTELHRDTDLGLMLAAEVTTRGLNALKNVIASCDGVMITLFLLWEGMGEKGRPSWQRIDRTHIFLFTNFLRDYFIPLDSDSPTFYKKVKEMKNYIFGNVSKGVPISIDDSPFPELSIFHDAIRFFQRKLLYRHQIVKLRVISDTRAVGLPPPVMREEAYQTFFEEATKPSEVPSGEKILLTRMSIRKVLLEVTEKENVRSIFERSFQNEKVSLSGSADLESTVNEGGKILSANLYIKELV
jgi:hypothetical protein